jgi:uncharacterized protein YicC (UPF0701 family)
MLKSMTGFGRCENATDEYKISVDESSKPQILRSEYQDAKEI